MNSNKFFNELRNSAEEDTAVVANLRRSAAYEPGQYPPAFRYVEPFVQHLNEWERTATYMAAAYWALAIRMGRQDAESRTIPEGQSLPKALKALQTGIAKASDNTSASKNIENRFLALLDADTDELQWRLRRITSQLAAADIAINWPSLLDDLRNWSNPRRRVQVDWASQFWSAPEDTSKANPDGEDKAKPKAKAKSNQ